MLELTGLTVGAFTYRRTRARPPLLRAAILAQVADFVALSFVIGNYAVESNGIARLILDAASPIEGLLGEVGAVWVGLLGLGAVKLALIAYLDWAAPHLGRYRGTVLWLAIVVGMVGAASNLVTALPQFIPV